MLPDWVSNPGPLTYESGALPIALRGQILYQTFPGKIIHHKNTITEYMCLFCKQIALGQLFLTI